MANERLKAAMSEAGVEPEQLADTVEADIKTVHRWIAGRIPRSRYRVRVAKALGKAEAEIWPEVASQPLAAQRRSDFHGIWASSYDEGASTWGELIPQASHTIELCDYSLIDVLQTPGAPQLLATKATAGVNVRLLIASLQSLWLALDDWPPQSRQGLATEGPLIQTVRQAHHRLSAITANTSIAARQALIPRCPAIRRFDDHMLVALPLWGTERLGAPVLHLRHHEDDGLFDRFAGHFQALWQTSWELEPAQELALPYPFTNAEPEGKPTRRPRLTPYGRRPPRRR
jgi:hypothetical protein